MADSRLSCGSSLRESSKTFSVMPKSNSTARAAASEGYVRTEVALCCGLPTQTTPLLSILFTLITTSMLAF